MVIIVTAPLVPTDQANALYTRKHEQVSRERMAAGVNLSRCKQSAQPRKDITQDTRLYGAEMIV